MSTTTEAITLTEYNSCSKETKQTKPSQEWFLPNQQKPSVWMLAAIAQSMFWLFGIPILCRRYVWDDLFGPLIASHPIYGLEIAEMILLLPIGPLFLISYNLVMIPIYTGQYSFFEQYKIQQHTCWPWFHPQPKVREEFWKLSVRSVKLTLFNMMILAPVLLVVKIYVYKELLHKDKSFFFSTDDDHWPTTGKNIRDIASLTLVHEFGFYTTHKLMHTYPFLYRYHKIHHEYKINTTLAAQHNHPVDYTVCIAGPALLAVILVPSSHSISQFQYLLWALWANLDDHVGYAFPWSPVRWFPGSTETQEHEYHHSKNNGCYSTKLSCFNTSLGGYEKYYQFLARCARKDKTRVHHEKLSIPDKRL